jgi:carbonic anhydrase/acetyltransferase-like protein (isoleucine patch superfamily)
VAVGSLLTPGMIIPSRSLVMGAPAKVKRPLTEEEIAGLNLFWQNYVEYVKKYRSQETGVRRQESEDSSQKAEGIREV